MELKSKKAQDFFAPLGRGYAYSLSPPPQKGETRPVPLSRKGQDPQVRSPFPSLFPLTDLGDLENAPLTRCRTQNFWEKDQNPIRPGLGPFLILLERGRSGASPILEKPGPNPLMGKKHFSLADLPGLEPRGWAGGVFRGARGDWTFPQIWVLPPKKPLSPKRKEIIPPTSPFGIRWFPGFFLAKLMPKVWWRAGFGLFPRGIGW
ncbi:MAG: hypothetical protein CM15mP45_12630 [Deltaproteobacteria bacterium]|nr:MAG: hypothetical protein CM15mP45_12630 [Deltaproteobacteria bacterium]